MTTTIEALGGRIGGAGTPAGERIAVTLTGSTLTVFTETGSHLFHTALVVRIEVGPHPGPTGFALTVEAPRSGLSVPTSFAPDQRPALEAIIAAVRLGSPRSARSTTDPTRSTT
jgi:hypothetical protein